MSVFVRAILLLALGGVAALPAKAQIAAPAAKPETAIEIAPREASTVVDRMAVGLAKEHYHRGRLDEAQAQLAVLAKRNALDVEGAILLGDIARERGDWVRAEQLFRAALQEVPDHGGLHLRLGQALQAMNRTDEADAAFARYVALNQGIQP